MRASSSVLCLTLLALGVASVTCQTPADAFAPWDNPSFNPAGSTVACGSPGVKLDTAFAGQKICFNAPAHYKLENNCVKNPPEAMAWGATEYLILRKWNVGGKTELFVTLVLVPVTPYDSTVYLYSLESNTVWTATLGETGSGDDSVLSDVAQAEASSAKRAIAHRIIRAVQLLAYGPADACRRDAKKFHPELQGLAAALKSASQQL